MYTEESVETFLKNQGQLLTKQLHLPMRKQKNSLKTVWR